MPRTLEEIRKDLWDVERVGQAIEDADALVDSILSAILEVFAVSPYPPRIGERLYRFGSAIMPGRAF